jgi:HEAT repeat-containing protein 5
LHKLNTKLNNSANLYNESLATLEKLAILKAWAEIYIVAMISNGSAPGSAIKQLEDLPTFGETNGGFQSPIGESIKNPIDDDDFGNFEFKGESLLKLVQPELENLANNWYAALKDHALLSLPPGIDIA